MKVYAVSAKVFSLASSERATDISPRVEASCAEGAAAVVADRLRSAQAEGQIFAFTTPVASEDA